MALSKEQLENCLRLVKPDGSLTTFRDAGRLAKGVRDALAAELHRLTHGPFTLAEAVASGRPFAETLSAIPTQWIVRDGEALFFATPSGEPSSFEYRPMARAMYEPMFRLKPEGGEG